MPSETQIAENFPITGLPIEWEALEIRPVGRGELYWNGYGVKTWDAARKPGLVFASWMAAEMDRHEAASAIAHTIAEALPETKP